MLQWYKSNRCLITVLIAGHRAAHAHIFTVTSNVGDDNSSTTFTFLRSLSHHFMGELPAMNNSNTSMPRAGVYLEMHAHTTATNSPIFHLTVQDLRESWSCKLWKDLFFPPLIFWKNQLKLCSLFFFSSRMEEITVSEIIDGTLKPSHEVSHLDLDPVCGTQTSSGAHYTSLCNSNDLSFISFWLSFFVSLPPRTHT